MQILCNNKSLRVLAQTLEEAILELGYQATHLATALNGEFVPKTERANIILKEGDRIEILSPMQGG